MKYRIDIENSSGVVQGSGPIASATFFEMNNEMDRTGSFSFGMSAADPQASVVTERNIARGYALMGGAWTEIGAGVIDSIVLFVSEDGAVEYLVSGLGISRELSQRSVRNLELASAGTFITHAAAVTAIDAYSPAGWTLTPAAAPANDNVYGRFAGDSVLAALGRVAEKTRTHFYYAGSRTLVFADSFTDSGVRAVQARGDLGSGICAIIALQRIQDTFDLKTRIIPYGAGQGDTRLTLLPSDRTAATGYTLDTANNYLENDTATATYGLDEIALEFKDVMPISNSDADVLAASNSLYDLAYEWLRRRSVRGEFYDVTLAECDIVLRPMQTIRVNYRDELQNVDIDTDLNILGASLRVDADGLRTTRLTVATLDRWAENDTSAIVGSIVQGQVFQAIPQLNANSYTTGYTKNVDDTEIATVRFRFGAEVTQLQQILLEFQLLQFESTVKTIALESETGGAGEVETDPASSTMGAISNNTSGTPSNNDSSTPSTNTSGAPSNNNSGAATGATGPSSGTSGGPSTNTSGAPSDNTSGSPSTNTSDGPSTNTSGANSDDTSGPDGGDVISGGQHRHLLTVDDRVSAGSFSPVYHDNTGGSEIFFTVGVGFSSSADTSLSGNHVHDLNSHTHTMASHTHDLSSHTHTMGNHTHTLSSHTHTLGAHTHPGGSHTHSLNSHTHTLSSHTHDLGNHTHTLSNHTHTLNNHIHTMTPVLLTTYGIFREALANTYGIDDLEYRVNSGGWADLNTATDVGSSWYQLDLTAALYNASSFRPLQTANTWQVRKKAAAADEKTVTIDALLSVRNIVQGIAYA